MTKIETILQFYKGKNIQVHILGLADELFYIF